MNNRSPKLSIGYYLNTVLSNLAELDMLDLVRLLALTEEEIKYRQEHNILEDYDD